jgi:hypothetical protein
MATAAFYIKLCVTMTTGKVWNDKPMNESISRGSLSFCRTTHLGPFVHETLCRRLNAEAIGGFTLDKLRYAAADLYVSLLPRTAADDSIVAVDAYDVEAFSFVDMHGDKIILLSNEELEGVLNEYRSNPRFQLKIVAKVIPVANRPSRWAVTAATATGTNNIMPDVVTSGRVSQTSRKAASITPQAIGAKVKTESSKKPRKSAPKP